LAKESWFDQSHKALLPSSVNQELLNFRDFPIFWWNFLIFEFPEGESVNWGLLKNNCRNQLLKTGNLIRKSPCEGLEGSLRPLLEDWARDFIVRHPKPGESDMIKLYNQSITKASLLMGSSITSFLRKDPFNSVDEYLKNFTKKGGFQFENHQGLFFDPKKNRVLIPIQLNVPPSETSLIGKLYHLAEKICEGLSCKLIGVEGPHFSTWQNETQVKTDIGIVSKIGWAILFLFVLFFVLSRKWRLLYLFPLLFCSMLFSALITYLIFGKIHGLTLSFGPSIVGLAMDYGLHGMFAKKDDKGGIWRANLFGLLTTLSIFVVLLFSTLPLLNQLAVFSITGLIISFVSFYIFKLVAPDLFHEKPFQLNPKKFKSLEALSFVFLFFSIIAFFNLSPDFSLQQLNFEPKEAREIRQWFFSNSGALNPMIEITDGEPLRILKDSAKKKEWANEMGIEFDGVTKHLPPIEIQTKNIDSWKPELCNRKRSDLIEDFFQPYWENLKCQKIFPVTLSGGQIPSYLKDYNANGKWVNLFFPTSKEEIKLIHQANPNSHSFMEITSLFSKTLSMELIWMLPLAILIALIFLFYYFLSLEKSLIALVPFFTGLGCFNLMVIFFELRVSFISIIGLIMMFGFSLDYGIFIVNLMQNKENSDKDGVWTTVFLSALTTLMGFAPLLFAGHPALQHLGQSLFFGAIGTFIGGYAGIPALFNLQKKIGYSLEKTI
jgi:MFS family permease